MDQLQHLDTWLALFTIGALIYYVGWQDYIRPALGRAKERRPTRDERGRFNGSEVVPAETERNETETRFEAVSGVQTPEDDAEMVAFRFVAKLVQAGMIKETEALEITCNVKAGSSKAYQDARSKLKRALEEVSR